MDSKNHSSKNNHPRDLRLAPFEEKNQLFLSCEYKEEKSIDVAKDSSEADENTDEEPKKRKDVMAFLKSKGAIGMKQDFSKAKGVDEGSEDRSLEDMKTIQTIRGLKKKKD